MHSVSTRLDTLGHAVACLRREREMTPDELAQPGFSAAFVAAVEHDRLRPSAATLAVLAARLAVAPALLDALPTPAPIVPDMAALAEDVVYQLEQIGQTVAEPAAARAQLDALAERYREALPQMPPGPQYRLHFLRARAWVRAGAPGRAAPDLEQALPLAEQTGDPEAVARVRNALGVICYSQDQPGAALAYHEPCLRAIATGQIKDLQLRLLIFSNLARDYWALADAGQAIGMYHEALRLLDDVNHDERRAAVYGGLGLAYLAGSDLERARLFTRWALALCEAGGSTRRIAQASANLGAVLLACGEYAAARACLARARALLEPLGDTMGLCTVYEHAARLELACGAVAQAAIYAQRSCALGAQAFQDREVGSGPPVGAHTRRDYARALAVAGQVAEQQGRPAAADGLFRQALALMGQVACEETANDIACLYAAILDARGAHASACAHYRAVAWRRRRRRRCPVWGA